MGFFGLGLSVNKHFIVHINGECYLQAEQGFHENSENYYYIF